MLGFDETMRREEVILTNKLAASVVLRIANSLIRVNSDGATAIVSRIDDLVAVPRRRIACKNGEIGEKSTTGLVPT